MSYADALYPIVKEKESSAKVPSKCAHKGVQKCDIVFVFLLSSLRIKTRAHTSSMG